MRMTVFFACSTLIASVPIVSCSAPPEAAAPTVVSSTSTTPPAIATTSIAGNTITSAPQPVTVDGWTVIEAPTVPITAAAVMEGRIVVGSCHPSGNGDLVTTTDPVAWDRAGTGCITQIELTPIGLLAVGPGLSVGFDRSWSSQRSVLSSADGEAWVAVALHERLGLEHPDQLGIPEAVFAAPGIRSVTVLFSRAAEAESRIATLMTTTDLRSWEVVEGGGIFDNSDIATVIPGADGLIAVGASPGGEFVPTAAVFTSADGVSWRRVTPITPDFEDKVMTDVIATAEGFVAIGGDFFETGLMTAWTSPDGLNWTRSPHPDDTLDPDVAFMTAHRITSVNGVLWASGEDYDASRPLKSIPALWRSDDGGRTWERVPDDVFVPFVLFDDGRARLATNAAGDVLLIRE